jgi:hypothetical protein
MLARHSFSKEWIAKQRERYAKADSLLIERQIYAFELLGLLIDSGKPFVFKGGTALILLLPVARRLSIDIDIVGEFMLDELAAIGNGSVFQRVEENERERKDIPKRHFKFYYTSVVDGRVAYVLLDVLYTSHGYPKVMSVPVVNNLFVVEAEVSVTTPTINGITGDKLTAFAPHTLGVPFGANKSMEIVKQLFDIGELFDHVTDIAELAAAYKGIWEQESTFRKQKYTVRRTLDDTIDTAFLLSQVRFKGSTANDELDELLKGINQWKNYFLATRFTIDEARVSAAKSAFLAAILRSGNPSLGIAEMRYSESRIAEIKDVLLDGRFQILNKLKATIPEAFYYWWLISQMEKR